VYFTNISLIYKKIIIIRLTLQTSSFAFEHTKRLASIFTITTRGSEELVSLTWTMFLRLSHRPLYYTLFTACRHLGSDPDLPDTILKGDHPRTIVAKINRVLLLLFKIAIVIHSVSMRLQTLDITATRMCGGVEQVL
jgi:hypothetical protein